MNALMKVGALTLMISLMLAWPALAGPPDPCAGEPDFDVDGLCDIIDNCSKIANASQTDGDQDGYGDACDCDYSGATANNACDGSDFGAFAGKFGTTVPPTNCEYDHIPNGAVDGSDFGAFAGLFGKPPGPSCVDAITGPLGVPCASPGAVCP